MPEKNIFVVEDDVFLAGVLLPHIERLKIKVELFNNGEDVVEALKTRVPQLMVLDLFLPRMTGLEVLSTIRKDPRLASLPVIVFSNSDKSEDRDFVKGLGAEFILKALMSPTDVAKHINEILEAQTKS